MSIMLCQDCGQWHVGGCGCRFSVGLQSSAQKPATDGKIATAKQKAPLHRLPLRWLIGLARVFQYGARKYGRENYYASADDPESCERYMGGVLRHLSEMQTPCGSYTQESCVALDAESGLPHIDHAIAGLVMLRARMCKAGSLPTDPREAKGMP